MIVRKLKDIKNTERDVQQKDWQSRRLLLKQDGMGFSLHDTLLRAGAEMHLCYRHHLEAVYCIEGIGSIQTVSDGKVWNIEPGTMYALNQHDEHFLRPETDMRVVCVFNPPVTGNEVHGADGAYPKAAS